MSKEVGGEEVAQEVDPVTGHTPTEKGKPEGVRELPHQQSNKSSYQSHATHHS
ncbi:hypothetical protein DPMN_064295 [Dreissena polymorpha]|uniref:Uncharacterized protein n=1 Tax=Dreissena polymorpha TaxID=45954 RepID=A0A9D4CCY2_DREPO|nr:hypothetical protein DPMN_064295 [Dreissena polymorpha]